MLNRFQGWRERGWTQIDAPAYAQAWQRFGGSVATHPLVIERLAALAEIPVRYLGWEQRWRAEGRDSNLGPRLALSKDVLKSHGKKGLFDLGNAELILPAAADAQAPLRHRGRYLSELNEGRLSTLKAQTESLAMARAPEDLSKKFRYNQRRELRLLEEAGGVVRAVGDFSSAELARIYCDLFQRRWGFAGDRCRAHGGCHRAAARVTDRLGAVSSTMRPSPYSWCTGWKRRSGSASNTSTVVSTPKPAISAPAAS